MNSASRRQEEFERTISLEFNKIYYDSSQQTWKNTYWCGVPIQKNPCDLWIYAELIHRVQPDLIIETGTLYGGSALYLASILEMYKRGFVVSIDKSPKPNLPVHRRIEYITGDSSSSEHIITIEKLIEKRCSGIPTVMVILDSDHKKQHVLKEMELYGPLVTPGSYMIIEDTNLNGHPVWEDFGPGPMEAVNEFLRVHSEFEVDRDCERLMLTFNPLGYLRRKNE